MWAVIETNDFEIHVFLEDERHLLEVVDSDNSEFIDGDIINIVTCNCKCQPRIEYENGRAIVIHGAFDGREALEETLEILKSS